MSYETQRMRSLGFELNSTCAVCVESVLFDTPLGLLRMLLTNSYFRAIIFGIVSLGMIVPAWATQPCKCSEKSEGCCATYAPATPDCCAERPCCAARGEQNLATDCSVPSVGCPCCTAAAPPTNTAPGKTLVTQSDQSSVAIFADVPGVVPPIGSFDYLSRSLDSPTGHPVLRLHALYRVWLN
jgi:hypothetical protein